ncbi:DUF2691 family protein [Niallia sp. FSL R7-0271]
MKRGVSFEIPNSHGNYLGEILRTIDISSYNWRMDGEAYLVENGELKEPLLPANVMDGLGFSERLEDNLYYCIFADLKAFPKGKVIKEIHTYDDFLKSDCQVVLLLVDGSFVAIYVKDSRALEHLYKHAISQGYGGIEYITEENDERIRLSVW